MALQINMVREMVFNSADYGIVIFDESGALIEFNIVAGKIFGLSDKNLGKYTIDEFMPEKLKITRPPYQSANDAEIEFGQCRYRVSDRQVCDEAGRPVARSLTFTDITKIRKAFVELENAARHDYLTGLFNRYAFYQELHRRGKESLPITVVRASVEGIDLINELFGNEYGDGVLQAVGQTLNRACRDDDVCARIDGIEFAFIMSRSEEDARRVFDEVSMQTTRVRDGADEITVNLVFGIASKLDDDGSVESIVKAALEDLKLQRLHNEVSRTHNTIANLRSILTRRALHDESLEVEISYFLTELGCTCGLSDKDLEELLLLSVMKDIGMVSVPPDIMKHRGSLSEREIASVRLHAVRGCRIAKGVPELAPIADEILHHHEHWDGSGYPDGLSGPDIPLKCRVLDIVRYYVRRLRGAGGRAAMPSGSVLTEMKALSGERFDPKIFEEFRKIVDVAEHPLDYVVAELR